MRFAWPRPASSPQADCRSHYFIPSDHARLEDTHCHSGVGRTTGKGKVMCQASLGRHVGTRNYKNCPKQQKKKRNCQALPIQEAVSRR